MNPHVLVVEDSHTQAEQLRSALEAFGYRVSLAADGAAGYERVLAERPDAVVTDIVMPNMDGYELCRAVKSHPGVAHTPVLLLTSLTDPAELLRAVEAGADNFLRKPFDPALLRARLGDVLQSRAEPRPGEEHLEAEVSRVGRRVTLAFEKHQILDLMFSSFEELVVTNAQLRVREEKLRTAQAELQALLDLTERERRRLAAVLSAIPEAMLVVEADGTVGHATAEAGVLLGRGADDIVGTPVLDVLPLCEVHEKEPEPLPPDRHPVARVLSGEPSAETGHTYGTWLPGPGGFRPVAVRAAGVAGQRGSTTTAVAVVHDLSGLGLRDRTTGLAGPDLFNDRVREAVTPPGGGGQTAVLLIGLDRFEAIREALGDEARAFLVATARRVEDAVAGSTGAVAAYLGRDEFGVLLPATTPLAAEGVARRLLQALRQPVDVAGESLSTTVSLGLALSAGDTDGVGVLHAAGTALHRARQGGGNCVELPDEAHRDAALARLRLESELREAAASGALSLFYKPQVRLATGEIVAVEVLVAWPHPVRGMLDAGEFLPLAEETGVITEIVAWALADACRTVGRWRRVLPGAETLQLALTAGTRWLRSPGFPDQVRAALAGSGLPPEALILGLAEGTSPDEEVTVRSAAAALHRLGVEVAVVDFGRRSSLQSPRHLGAQRLILESSLVAAMTDDIADAALVAGVVRLAHGVGLQTLATGVTGEEQALSLRLIGCDLAQGPFLAPRHEPRDFEAWWQARYRDRGGRTAAAASDPSGEELAPAAVPGGRLEPSDDLRDEVLTYLAHELRNPLSVIAVSAQMLDADRDRIDPSLHDLLATLGRATSHLSRIIDSLYDLRAAHLGVLRVDKAPRDLAADVRQVLAEAPGIRERELRTRLPPSCLVAADGERVRQVLVNLVGNAVKYTAPGTVIELELGRQQGLVSLSVRDHGPGIPAGRRHELFRKFARLGNPAPGTGLGLFLSRAIARAHGGDLVYEAPDGPGARFVLTLPAGA